MLVLNILSLIITLFRSASSLSLTVFILFRLWASLLTSSQRAFLHNASSSFDQISSLLYRHICGGVLDSPHNLAFMIYIIIYWCISGICVYFLFWFLHCIKFLLEIWIIIQKFSTSTNPNSFSPKSLWPVVAILGRTLRTLDDVSNFLWIWINTLGLVTSLY